MDQLATGVALDPAALGAEIHQAQESNGAGEREQRGDVGIHEGSCDEFPFLTQNAAFQCGHQKSNIIDLKLKVGPEGFEPSTKRL